MIVLDASALICVLLNTPLDRASALRRRLRAEQLHAPHLIDLEVVQTLRRFVLGGRLEAERAADALSNLGQFPLARHAHHPLLQHVWRLRANLTAYDAAYVALAQALEAPLVTLDARIARAGARATIEVL